MSRIIRGSKNNMCLLASYLHTHLSTYLPTHLTNKQTNKKQTNQLTNYVEQSHSSQANVPHLVKKFYGTRRFITVFTKARHIPIMNHINPAQAIQSCSFQLNFTLCNRMLIGH